MPIPELKQRPPCLGDRPEKSVKPPQKETLKTIALIGMLGVLILSLFGALGITVAMAWISRDLPNPNTLLTREIPQTTKIYDRTGEMLLYEIHGDEKRTLVTIEEIPDQLKEATIALEDRSFYEHHGINWLRLGKAILIDIVQGRKAQGASTLTQQLVKNAILTREKTFTRKFKEMLLAMQIERQFTKDQILQMYLNEIPYGSMVYGVASASETYFGKKVNELTLDEAALLAAIPQAPDRFNPYGSGVSGDHRDDLVARQHITLDAMVRDKYITKEEAESAKQIKTLEKLLPQELQDIKAPHFVMYVREKLIESYGQKEIEQGGLRVITTLDWEMQKIAREEIEKNVEKNGKAYGFTNGALVAMDPKNGNILTMVGSADFFNEEIDGQVNVATSPRQPGSSFKPIVYTAGFMKGYTPETVLWDVETIFKTDTEPYAPKNYDGEFRGPMTVRSSLQGSLNIPAVKMLYLVGVGRVLDFAEQLGYSTLGDRHRFGLSLVLGGGEVTLLEHVNAYAAFANRGKQFSPVSILKIEQPDGEVLYEWEEEKPRQAVPEEAANQISNILSDNEARSYVFGLYSALTLPNRQVAAKTGTTNDNNDAWTMGYTPNLAAGVWVGNSSGLEMKEGADGSVVAAPVWQAFMKRATENMPKETFPVPKKIETDKPVLNGESFKKEIEIDIISGKLATEYTPEEFRETQTFYEGHNILWYVDKDDPRGPAPKNPEKDPQFQNWEDGVLAWIEKEGWNATGTAPTEYDDVHTSTNRPTVGIRSPRDSTTVQTREPQIITQSGSNRRIVRTEVHLDGMLIGEIAGNAERFTVQIPNSVPRGYHELMVTVIDDVGNKGFDSATINLTAEPLSMRLQITSPQAGQGIYPENFPLPVIVTADEISDIQKIDLILDQSGSRQILGSSIMPQEKTQTFDWKLLPSYGNARISAEAWTQSGEVLRSDPVYIQILKPAPKTEESIPTSE